MGHRFRGRMLVEPGGFAHFEPLLRGGEPTSDDPTVGRKGRPRAESRLLLRALPSAAGRHVDKVRRRKARKLHNHAVSLVVLGGARKARQESSFCSSGTTLPGTSPRRFAGGSANTIEESRTAAVG